LLFACAGLAAMFSFMKKDKADKREKKERKETKKPPTKDAAAASLFHQQSSSGSGSGGVVYGASAAAGSSSANVDKLTADELLRLDEVRRSLKIRTRRKEKEKLPSGITADYTAHLGLHLVDGGHASSGPWPELPHSPISDGGSCTSDGTPSLNSLTSTTTMMMMKQETLSVSSPMPVPPARGILKGKSSYGLESPPLLELDDDNKLVENTLKNELIIYEKPPAVLGAKKLLSSPSAAAQLLPPPLPKSQPPSSSANGHLGFQRARAAAGGGMQTEEEDAFTYSSPRPHLAPLDAATAAAIAAAAGLVPADNSRPPSAATAKPTTTTAVAAVKVLWSEPPGEGSGWLDRIKTHKSLHSSSSSSSLPLPALVEPALPEPRDLTLQRKETGDFGFSLRRSVVVERSPNDPSRY
jgi:myosin-18